MNLRITKQGKVYLPSQNYPPDFDAIYTRVSYRDTRIIYSSEGVNFTARLSMEKHNSISVNNSLNGELVCRSF